jgi:hypothetical protein
MAGVTDKELKYLVKRAAMGDTKAQIKLREYSDRAQAQDGVTVRDTRAIAR